MLDMRGQLVFTLADLLMGMQEKSNIKKEIRYEELVGDAKLQKSLTQAYMPHAKHLDKLGLICQAMWTLIKDKTDLTDEDLMKMVTELDLKDGKLDGKYTKPPVDCPNCSAKICKKFNRCLFCGEEYTEGSAFDTV